MITGAKPKPTQLQLLRNASGKQSKVRKPREPRPVGDLQGPPDYLDAETKREWDYAIKHAPPHLLKMIDAGILETWCTAHVLYRRANAELRKFGMLMKAPNAQVPIQSPYLPIVNKQAMIMMRCVEHLGFSPMARVRLIDGDVGPADHNHWDDVPG